MNFHDFSATGIFGDQVDMKDYQGKVVLVVNTASKCGLTPQFKDLEEIYEQYKDKNFEILGFPCNQFAGQDPGSNEEIQNFCQLNYGVTFTMLEKVDVNGEQAHPIFKYLKSQTKSIFGEKIKWNFTKFLIDADGNVVKRYAPSKSPLKIKGDIEKLLKK